MTRTGKWSLPIHSPAHRQRAHQWLDQVPEGYVITIAEPSRNNEQNALMWALLADISEQATHANMRFAPEDWKDLLMAQLRKEMRLVPNLDHDGFVPIGNRTSKLTKTEFSDLIELILKLGAEKGVSFNNGREDAA